MMNQISLGEAYVPKLVRPTMAIVLLQTADVSSRPCVTQTASIYSQSKGPMANRIEDYALIANQKTVALVGRDGLID